jgi:ubiquinone/menaquinone biosynthesis C-methylase UbiE
MADVYATITEADPGVLDQLAEVLELRAADPQQKAMRESYLADVPLAAGTRVLEVGCGTGAVTRAIARIADSAIVTGVDPSPAFVAKARGLSDEDAGPNFDVGDGRDLPYEDGSFDVVVFHTTLCHIPGPELALGEAHRVLVENGHLAVFDGDYATTTVATGDSDPLQAAIEAIVGFLVHDKWLVRRLPRLVAEAGFEVIGSDSFGYVETTEPSYMLTLVDRGADLLVGADRIGPDVATALKGEARRRVEAGVFFGHIAYGVVHAVRAR